MAIWVPNQDSNSTGDASKAEAIFYTPSVNVSVRFYSLTNSAMALAARSSATLTKSGTTATLSSGFGNATSNYGRWYVLILGN